MDELTKAWAAGLFDGEGHVQITKQKRNGVLQVGVVMSTTSRKISDVFMTNWGGHYPKTQTMYTGSTNYSVIFDRVEAQRFLIDVYPYLIEKQAAANIVLRALYLLPKKRYMDGTYSDGITDILQPFYQEFVVLREGK